MEPETSPQPDQTAPQEERAKIVTPKVAERGRGPLTPEEQAAKRTQTLIIIGAVVFLVLLVAAIVLMARFPTATQVVRDIAIVFVAVVSFLIGLAMILLIFQIQVLIQVLRDEIQPLLHSVNDTVATVRGTTEFMSHNMVTPIIKAAGFASGLNRVVGDLVSVLRVTRRSRNVTQIQNDRPKGGNTDGQAGE